ncbi:unnamed protein product [Caenorhabditis brenneri]
MLLPVVFHLFFFLPCSVCDTKLMQVNGKVIGTTQGTLSDSDCLIDCYYNSTCFLVYLDAERLCTVFSYLDNPKNLSVVAADDGSQVYIKATFPTDTCPSTLKSTSLTYYSLAWKPTTNGWIFSGCRDNWHLSVRSENLSVCIKGFSGTRDRDSAVSFCKDDNSKMIGVQSVEESQWMKKEIRNLTNNRSGRQFFWFDGVRNCTGIESGCRWFTWSDGFANCLVIMGYEGYIINDVVCTADQQGMFCGYKLN